MAVRKEARELEAETFALKDPVWAEYDPAFFHMTVQVRLSSHCKGLYSPAASRAAQRNSREA